jgi:hypothetical protein
MIGLETIREIFQRNGLGEEFREQEPLLFWSRVAGEPLARLTDPMRVSQGVLYIEVNNHVIAQELSLMKDAYIKKINELLGESRVQDIRFRVRTNSPSQTMTPPDESGIQLSLLEREEMERVLDELEDPQLREAFAGLMNALAVADRARQAQGGHRCAVCGVHFTDEGELCFNCQLERGA